MIRSILLPCLILAPLAACGPSYSPDTYAASAAQQANKAEQGIIIGVRHVQISASGTVGTVTGAAAGGIAGSQATPAPLSAFTALGGSLVGGIAGSAVEHATSDTDAYEYIVKKSSGELVSVTQKDAQPLALGLRVLVIAGNQARVVQDYTDPALSQTAKPPASNGAKPDAAKPGADAEKPGEPAPAGAASAPQPASAEPAPAGLPSPLQATPGKAAPGKTGTEQL